MQTSSLLRCLAAGPGYQPLSRNTRIAARLAEGCIARQSRPHLAPRTLASCSRPYTSDPRASHQVAGPSVLSPSPAPPVAPRSLIDRLPRWARRAKPYLLLMRLDKPIGTMLLYWPCAWSITLASAAVEAPITTPLWYMLLFGTGAVVMRGAGCTINDMWDTKIDRAVDRTKLRPLAAGDITQFQALCFLGVQLSAGLAVLTQLNWYSIQLGAASLGLVVVYPLMKRITYYPQFFLGLAFNWGALLGWSAVAGAVDWSVALPLYAGGIAWTVMYDTIYAHQDKLDDVLVNVKSTALRFGESSRLVCSALAASSVGCLALAGYAASASPAYYAVACGGAAVHAVWQLRNVDFDNRASCWKMFVSNQWLGAIVWAGTALDYLSRVLLGLW